MTTIDYFNEDYLAVSQHYSYLTNKELVFIPLFYITIYELSPVNIDIDNIEMGDSHTQKPLQPTAIYYNDNKYIIFSTSHNNTIYVNNQVYYKNSIKYSAKIETNIDIDADYLQAMIEIEEYLGGNMSQSAIIKQIIEQDNQ